MLSLVSTVPKKTLLLGDFNVNNLVSGDNAEFKAILNLYGFYADDQKSLRE